jgi:hypothetical protein
MIGTLANRERRIAVQKSRSQYTMDKDGLVFACRSEIDLAELAFDPWNLSEAKEP